MSAKFPSLFSHTYAFRFRDAPAFAPVWLQSVGWEKVNSTLYDWDGLARGHAPMLLFQYTLSGRGSLQLEGQTYHLTPGTAFFVHIPSAHRYFFPADSESWEYLYLTLDGNHLGAVYEELVGRVTPVCALAPDSPAIKLLKEMLEQTQRHSVSDAFAGSALAYRFLMELARSALQDPFAASEGMPEPIQRALKHIELHFETIQGLEDLAALAGLSKYHFLRLFKARTGMTPMDYVHRLRMEKAAALLRGTADTVEAIALATGYANGNYFSKVFRKWVGVSPGAFRSQSGPAAGKQLFIR